MFEVGRRKIGICELQGRSKMDQLRFTKYVRSLSVSDRQFKLRQTVEMYQEQSFVEVAANGRIEPEADLVIFSQFE